MSIGSALGSVKKKGLRKSLSALKRRIARDRLKGDLAVFKKNAAALTQDDSLEMSKKIEMAGDINSFIISNLTILRYSDLAELCTGVAKFIAAEQAGLDNSQKLELSSGALAFASEQCKNKLKLTPELEKLNGYLWELEKDGSYNKFLKDRYIKELYPAIYAENSGRPVENKVVVMESGNSPSPSSSRLASVIREEGLYKVVYVGLKVRKVPNAVFYNNGCRLIRELATAKALFLSTTNELLSYFDVREETRVIQLWHGVGAFKHVGYSTVDNAHFGKTQAQWDEFDSFRNIYAVTIAGEGQRWIFRDSMHLDDEQILPIGIARTDVFFDDEYRRDALDKLHENYPQTEGKRLILYAPTFRGEVAKAKAPDRLDIEKLAEAVSGDSVLLIKHHGLSKDVPAIPDGLEGSFAFDMNTNKILNIEQLLTIADVLITDYSSVAFEYAILERPIIFFTYDLDQYVEERGLYFDFRKEAPGPLCFSTEEVVECLSGPESEFDRQRLQDFRQKYVEACDGHSIERTIALIEG